jgi:predicted alpha/beta-hydrolase family hydrolase
VTAAVETEERFAVDLPSGPAEVSAAFAHPGSAWATVVIAHGAGAGYRHPFLRGFARGLGELGIATLRFNFPYLEAGRGCRARLHTPWPRGRPR